MFNPKFIMTSLILAVTMTVSLSQAADRGGFRPNNNANQNSASRVHNRNGRREQLDSSARAERFFSKLDTDNSGVVTLDEFLVKPISKAMYQFSRIDSNDDKLISLEEFLAIHHNKNNNSNIDRDAVRACIIENSDLTEDDLPDNRPDGSTRFTLIDTNQDGVIDSTEFESAKTEKATNKFNRIDSNNDGGITLEELLDAIATHKALREVRKSCIEIQEDEDAILEG